MGSCVCGHAEEEHSVTGECQVGDCLCARYDEEPEGENHD